MYLLVTALALSAAPPDPWQQLAARHANLARPAEPSTRDGLYAAGKRESEAWAKLKSKQDWEKYRDVRIAALKKSLGQFPEVPKDLKVQVRKTIEADDYRIDCLTFESRPGLLVTANLYRPAKATKGMPGISIVHSHHNPKTEGELQDMGVMWAKAGCYVLVMDQLGHGERRQHPFATAKDFPKEFRVSRQDYYFRYNLAVQLQTIGDSLMGWMVWDIQRGIDVLLKQPGIDPEKIILLGSVAGGGDPCAVAAALDERIKCAAPFNFGGPQPEWRHPLPDDAETSFLYSGSGSWESTRNLYRSARDGFLPWVIDGAVAPRKYIYSHEFAWDRERDPVWKRLQKIHEWYGSTDTLASTNGAGSVRGKQPESTHCNNIGPAHRKAIHVAMKKWFGIDAKEPVKKERRAKEELWCLKEGENAGKVYEIAGRIADARIAAARVERAKTHPKVQPELLRKEWMALLGIDALPKDYKPGKSSPVYCGVSGIEAVWLEQEATLLLMPKEKVYPLDVVVMFSQGGPAALWKHQAEWRRSLKPRGTVAVALVDLGAGSNEPAYGRDGSGRASSQQMLGRPAVGVCVERVLKAVAALRKQPGINPKTVKLYGRSFAQANADGAGLSVPHDLAQPRVAAPLGPTVALLAGLLDGGAAYVHAEGGLVSYRSLLNSQFVHVPYNVVVPGALTTGDLVDVAAALAPRVTMFNGLVDGLNRKVPKQQREKAFAVARQAYKDRKEEAALIIGD